MTSSVLDDMGKIRKIDKGNMLSFCVNAARHYQEAAKMAERVSLQISKPTNIIVAGMGGSGIGGELLKDWARDKVQAPIETSKDYFLPSYANENSLVLIVSYSGETEESLSALLDAAKRKCMIQCIGSGGSLLEFAEKLNVPYLRIPSGMPPRAALPYLFMPLFKSLEKMNMVSSASADLSEMITILERIGGENAPANPTRGNFSKSLALGIVESSPVVYGFGIYRSVAQRFKQQFNENCKVPSKSESFPELNHNEIEGWEKAGKLAKCFSAIFIRDKDEPNEIRSRIEITKTLIHPDSKMFEVWSQGKSSLAKMLSTICIGDFTSVYLAILRKVDPTPVNTIALLKKKMKQSGTKEKIISELKKITVK